MLVPMQLTPREFASPTSCFIRDSNESADHHAAAAVEAVLAAASERLLPYLARRDRHHDAIGDAPQVAALGLSPSTRPSPSDASWLPPLFD